MGKSHTKTNFPFYHTVLGKENYVVYCSVKFYIWSCIPSLFLTFIELAQVGPTKLMHSLRTKQKKCIHGSVGMKGGLLMLIMMLHVLVAPCFSFASSGEDLVPTSASENAKATFKKSSAKLQLSTIGLSARKYNDFIAAVREALTLKGDKSHGIPVLPCDPPQDERHVFVNLVNKAWYSIQLVLDVTRADIIGYSTGQYSCVFEEGTTEVVCYHGVEITSQVRMKSNHRGSHPVDHVAEDLESLRWGTNDLDIAIKSLSRYASGQATKQELNDGIRTCIMMIEHAARYPVVERRMSAGIKNGNDVSDDPSLRSLSYRRWLSLSEAIEESYQGVLSAPITLRRRNNELLSVDNVRRAIPLISLMYCHCGGVQQEEALAHASPSSSRVPMLIRSVVQGGTSQAPACKKTETTTRIVGPGGMCITASPGVYISSGQLLLSTCNDTNYVNQLWTFKMDGTIRSNGMCMARGGYKTAVISRCPNSPTDTVVWDVRDDGTIVSKSGLVVTVDSTANRTVVSLGADNGSTGQSWTPTNNTNPFVGPIVGFDDLCLQADGADIWMADCVDGKPEQAWALYPDGSIRPQLNQSACLAPDPNSELNRVVRVFPCNPASPQRWVFQNDGSILNSARKLVLDVKESAPWLRQIIVYPATGNPNQKWTPML